MLKGFTILSGIATAVSAISYYLYSGLFFLVPMLLGAVGVGFGLVTEYMERKNKPKEKPRKHWKPNPLMTLFTMIAFVIGVQIVVPESINYYNWVGLSWTAFWWIWMFPFFFIKIYDWYTVRKLRKSGGGGSSNPWVRMIGILILAMLLTILLLYGIFWLIGQASTVRLR